MVVRVGMSWNLGVKPARTTLSDEAIHSMMSAQVTQSVWDFSEGRIGFDEDSALKPSYLR